jgi:hypothetical protein
MSALIERLRSRKLVQWGLAYLAGAWVLLEVLSQVGEHFAWPNLILRLLTVALALGLLPALVLAWYHGEQGRQRVTGPELMILTVLLLTAGGVLWLVGRPGGASVAPAVAAATRADAIGDRRSLAVLPFASLSADPENSYFAGAIHDELLTQLSKLGDLRVISHLGDAVRGHDQGDRPDRGRARRWRGARGQRAAGGQPGARAGAADRRRHRRAPVGR